MRERRGTIIWLKPEVRASLGIHVQDLNRPFIIISNNKNNKKANTLNISPLSKIKYADKNKTVKKLNYPMHVYLDKEKYNLEYDSLVLVEQTFTIGKDKIQRILGCLDDSDMKKLNKAAYVQFIDENLLGFTGC